MITDWRVRPLTWSTDIASRHAAAGAKGAAAKFHALASWALWASLGPVCSPVEASDTAGAGAEPRILVLKDITVSPRKRLLSDLLQPARLARSARFHAKGLRLKAAALAWGLEPDRARLAGSWHISRARGLERPVKRRLGECGKNVIELCDHATGEVIISPVGCQQALCPTCRKKRASKTARRLRAQLAGYTEYQRVNFKRKPQLWSITLRDSGNPAKDALIMREAWKNFRSTWRDSYGWAFPFIRYEEITTGKRGQGHNHWHAVVWHHPMGKRSLSQLNHWWKLALGTAARRLGTTCDAGTIHVSDKHGPAEAAAAYAGKVYAYISKESFELEDLDTELAADYLDTTYGMRRFTTSRYLLAQSMGPSRFTLICLRAWRPGDPGGIEPQQDDDTSPGAPATGPPDHT